MKAHFVASCYEEDLSNSKTDPLMCSYNVMHFVILTASVMSWQVETLDFISAFMLGGMWGERGVS